jgi:subtilisin family serine protease
MVMTFKPTCFALALLAVAGAAAAQIRAADAQTYIVQLTEQPAAGYAGGLPGLQATRPAAGQRFNARDNNVRAYRSYLLRRQQATLAPLGQNVRMVHQYTVALNGYAAVLTSKQARQLKAQAGVLSVEPAGFVTMDTHNTPEFLGLSVPGGLWSKLDARSNLVKGEDVIVGILDGGIWPENPSFGDKVDASGAPVAYHQPGVPAYGAAPAGWAGTCQTGPGFTAAMCGGKLIGARFYNAGFLTAATPSAMEYASPRDTQGHGSHTAATAAGNEGAPALLNGVNSARVSGVAPRARIAAYKVCWAAAVSTQNGCYNADLVRAIDDAITDGVHVLNMSISGSQVVNLAPVNQALLSASAAGVFVAVSAGNGGPANTVAHVVPWVTTVAASTDDRSYVTHVNLGNGQVLSGISSFRRSLDSTPLVLGSAAAMPGLGADGGVCRPGSLDPARTAGRLVVCDRNSDVTRLEKSAEVKRAGGVGMLLVNVVADNRLADEHSVPGVHLADTVRDSLVSYAGSAGARAALQPGVSAQPAPAPQMASFSSRGPNRSVASIMKPDITAPGVQIVAASVDTTLSQAQHDALVLGNFTPAASSATMSGTSMSSPHVAGVAALIKQLHPSWSPAAIKSAMQTSASGVKLYTGAPDLDVAGYGAGHVSPNGASVVPLVYDLAGEDYAKLLCGMGLGSGGLGNCAELGSVQPWDLNLAGISAGATDGNITLNRTVTNVTGAQAVFNASASMPGWSVTVTPSQLKLAPGEKGSFKVDMVALPSANLGLWTTGSLTWSDGTRSITSPLVAQLSGFKSPAVVTDNRKLVSGRKVYTVVPGRFVSPFRLTPNGLVPATLTSGRAMPGAAACTDIVVPTGAQVLRAQLFNADTEGGSSTDLNLQLIQGSGGVGAIVATSSNADSNEAVSLLAPAAGTYSACVVSATVPSGGAAYTLSSWALTPGSGGGSLRALVGSILVAGSPTSIALSWVNATLGQRYLGSVTYLENNVVRAPLTQVLIDNK